MGIKSRPAAAKTVTECVLVRLGLVFILFLVVGWPGALDVDAVRVWAAADAGVYDGWHPSFIGWLLVSVGPAATYAIATLSLCVALSLLLRTPALFVVLLLPPVVLVWLRIGKESFYTAALLWLVASDLKPWRLWPTALPAGTFAARAFAAAMAVMCRAQIAPVLLLLSFRRRGWPWLVACLIGISCGLVVARFAWVARPSWPEQQVFIHDLSMLDPHALSFLCRRPDCAAEIVERRTALSADAMVWGPTLRHVENHDELSALRAKWARAVVEHPWAYFHHRGRLFAASLGFLGPLQGVVAAGAVPNPFSVRREPRPLQAWIAEQARVHADSHLLRPWPYFLFLLIVALWRPQRMPRTALGLVLGQLCLMFLMAPSPQLRYSFAPLVIMFCAVFSRPTCRWPSR